MVYILAISIILQLIAAISALRLIKTTREFKAWTAISLAVALMAIRRTITFYGLIKGDPSIKPDMTAELVALATSFLMAVGIIWIFPVFNSIKMTNKALNKSNRALKTLSECNQTIIRIPNEQNLTQEICRIIIEFGGYKLAWVGFAEHDRRKTVRPVAQYGFEDGYLEKASITWADDDRGRGPTGTAIRTGKPYIARFISTNPNFTLWREAALARGYESSIALPLFANDQILGALNIYAKEPDAFDDEELKLLNELADDLSFAINAIRTREQRNYIEQARNISEKKYQMLFDTIHEGFALCEIVYDQNKKPTDFRFLEINPAFEELIGFKRENINGKTIREVLPEIESYLTGIDGEAALKHETIQFENYSKALNRHFLVNAFSPQEGQLVMAFMDITVRKKAEEQIQNQLNHLNALRKIDISISGSLDLRIVLDVINEQCIQQLGVDAVCISAFDPNFQTLEYKAIKGFNTSPLQHTKLKLGEDFAGQVALERKMIHIPDLQEKKGGFIHSKEFENENFVSYYGVPLISKGHVKGVLEVFHRSLLDINREWEDFLETLAGQAAIAMESIEQFENLLHLNTELAMAYDKTIEGWSNALDLRDEETEGHTLRVTELTMQLASHMGMDKESLVHLRRGALLHDIGKMGIPDNILLRPGKLTDEEWKIVKKHPQYAYDLLSQIKFLNPAIDIPYYHHEKWDGTGYPHGLKGNQIPFAARIFAVADVWDALRSDRPYRKAWPESKALAYIKEQSGKHFDPIVVKNFLELNLKAKG